jgi:hypothetical protein
MVYLAIGNFFIQVSNVESIEKNYLLYPVDGHNAQRNRQHDNKQENPHRKRKEIISIESEQKTNEIVDSSNTNVTLLFGVDKISGEAEALLFDKNNNTSRSINFEEVTRANDNIIERRGIIFDKRL